MAWAGTFCWPFYTKTHGFWWLCLKAGDSLWPLIHGVWSSSPSGSWSHDLPRGIQHLWRYEPRETDWNEHPEMFWMKHIRNVHSYQVKKNQDQCNAISMTIYWKHHWKQQDLPRFRLFKATTQCRKRSIWAPTAFSSISSCLQWISTGFNSTNSEDIWFLQPSSRDKPKPGWNYRFETGSELAMLFPCE